uniref:Uncharacterized protein n=1 Tax=Rhizophora mucronata TaxID=61149 RepID=A0A2P2PIN2_RHIMU
MGKYISRIREIPLGKSRADLNMLMIHLSTVRPKSFKPKTLFSKKQLIQYSGSPYNMNAC